ncbi:MAG: quinolinate synthase NadA [Planctomycetes bacterium]|nr:quinolinate synthase NadA [Planctomycetota bacterium]
MSEALVSKIEALKAEHNAVILAHYYAPGDVQDVADYVGDSLGLSRTAATTEADVIVFSGVHFMAETAAILSPEKKVIMPDACAGCPMADMITAEKLAQFKAENPGAVVVTYVNSAADIKALSDICCTSSNAVNVVRTIPEDKDILFVPDQNLGSYVSKVLGRKMIMWKGFCPTHQNVLPEHVLKAREEHPDALFAVHPECRPAVVELADFVGSTTGIINFCAESDADKFIIGTENGVFHKLKKDNPDKEFFLASPVLECPNMKKNTLEKLAWCLEDMKPLITVDPEIARKAKAPIERMLEVAGSGGK